MRTLTKEEIEQALGDNGELDEGCEAVETSVRELADMGAGTCCGTKGNRCFTALVEEGYGEIRCRGWILERPLTQKIEGMKKLGLPDAELQDRIRNISACLDDRPEVVGMFHMEVKADGAMEKIEQVAAVAGGSLRPNGDSQWEGFKEFEIE